MKIGLGSAQFGLDYGISNRQGMTPEAEVNSILTLAWKKGITLLDTATAYGTSEDAIGRSLPVATAFSLVTKTPLFRKERIDPEDAAQLEKTFRQSLARLRQPALYGLLIHHAPDLLAPGGSHLWEALEGLKEAGLVSKIGVSVYSPREIEEIAGKYRPDLVQLPLNILDQRMILGGHLEHLKKMGVEIHSRSVFLQGLLLMPPQDWPSHFDSVRPQLAQYHDDLKRREISPLASALAFVCRRPEIDRVIVGVNNRAHLEEILREAATMETLDAQDCSGCSVCDESIINPSLWRRS